MAKRGRPKVEIREKEYCEVQENDIIIQGLLTAGGSRRSMANAFYSMIAYVVFSEAASEIPYWKEIEFKNCITEQLGRMLAQDHYYGHNLVVVAQRAAEAYHAGYTAKAVAEYIKGIRMSGHLDE